MPTNPAMAHGAESIAVPAARTTVQNAEWRNRAEDWLSHIAQRTRGATRTISTRDPIANPSERADNQRCLAPWRVAAQETANIPSIQASLQDFVIPANSTYSGSAATRPPISTPPAAPPYFTPIR